MDKKNLLINVGLVIVLVVCVIVVIIFQKIDSKRLAQEAEDNIKLTEIGYGSEIGQVGYENAKGILKAFVEGYNEHDGEGVAAIMDQVGLYIYVEECDKDESKFDDKYEEILSNPSGYKDLIIMQYSLKNQEQALVDSITDTNVTLEVVENSEIQDVTKYLSKMTAKIRTVSPDDGVDQTNTLEFLLLHKNNSYYIMNYYAVNDGVDEE